MGRPCAWQEKRGGRVPQKCPAHLVCTPSGTRVGVLVRPVQSQAPHAVVRHLAPAPHKGVTAAALTCLSRVVRQGPQLAGGGGDLMRTVVFLPPGVYLHSSTFRGMPASYTQGDDSFLPLEPRFMTVASARASPRVRRVRDTSLVSLAHGTRSPVCRSSSIPPERTLRLRGTTPRVRSAQEGVLVRLSRRFRSSYYSGRPAAILDPWGT